MAQSEQLASLERSERGLEEELQELELVSWSEKLAIESRKNDQLRAAPLATSGAAVRAPAAVAALARRKTPAASPPTSPPTGVD